MSNTGDSVICIRNMVTQGYTAPFKNPLTIGKSYEILGKHTNRSNELFYLMVNDNGHLNYHEPSFFISIQEHRENQLEKLIKY